MKILILSAVAAAALFSGAISAQALEETDRALGAGSYVNPNGSDRGAWSATRVRSVTLVPTSPARST